MTKALTHTSWTARTFSAVNTLTDLGPLLVIGFAAYEVIQGQLTLGTMVAFVGYMDSLYSPLRRLVNSSTTLTQSFASMDRVFELLDEKYDIVNVPSAVQTTKLNGEVIFDNVSFRYNADEKEILHNLSLTMLPGEKVALVGASGEGSHLLLV